MHIPLNLVTKAHTDKLTEVPISHAEAMIYARFSGAVEGCVADLSASWSSATNCKWESKSFMTGSQGNALNTT